MPSAPFAQITHAVFSAGLDANVVEHRWQGIARALAWFEPDVVAAFTAEDVERLLADPSVIRNRPKLEATVHNARRIVALEEEHGSFADWLAEHAGRDAACAALRGEFRYLGAAGAGRVLDALEAGPEGVGVGRTA